MSPRASGRANAVWLIALAAACGGPKNAPAASDSAIPTGAMPPAVGAPESAGSTGKTAVCPRSGNWQACNVEDRLLSAGLVFEKRPDVERHDFLRVAGTVYATSRTEIQVFIYPSAAERARDTDALDAEAVAPKGKRVIWKQPATLVTSGNLAAIVLGLNGREVERVANALGAGLPPVPSR